jgi:hypothetical protein
VLQGSALQAAITISITQISNDSHTGLQELEDIVDEWGGSFGYIQASAAFVKAAKLRRLRAADAKPLLDRLASIWDGLLPVAEPRQLANVLWACAKLRINPGDAALNSLLQAMALPAMLEAAVPQNLSNTLRAATELQQRCSWQPVVQRQVWERLLSEQQLRRTANHGTPSEVSSLVCFGSAVFARQFCSSTRCGSNMPCD